VAGGRGFVGSHVVHALVAAGYRPVVFGPAMAEDRLASIAGRYDEAHGSVEDRAALAQAFAIAKPAAVISCVAHGAGRLGLMRSGEAEADAAIAVNVAGHGKLLDAAREAGVTKVVWTSSTVVYGPASLYGAAPVDEDARRAPVTFYGLTKTLAESLSAYNAQRHGLDVVGLRLPLILGLGLWYQGVASAIVEMFAAVRKGAEASIAFHDSPLDFMHVADVAKAVLAALRQPPGLSPVYNLEGFRASVPDLIAEIGRIKPGSRIAFQKTDPALLFPLVDGGRFRRATGFAPDYDRAGLVTSLLQLEKEGIDV
jgi:nucleoside-diphosphate-sugar epimerase